MGKFYFDNFLDTVDFYNSEVFDSLDEDIEDPVVCECGSEKVYGTNTKLHSDWCAKKEKKER